MRLEFDSVFVGSLVNSIPLERFDGYDDRLLHFVASDLANLLLAVFPPLLWARGGVQGVRTRTCTCTHASSPHPPSPCPAYSRWLHCLRFRSRTGYSAHQYVVSAGRFPS